jgi:transcriptional regulator with XRE-family HTH domain
MAKPKVGRKARFMAALRIAGMTQTEWAEENGVTQGHLSQVLSGIRESQSLSEKIDAFAAKHLAAAA